MINRRTSWILLSTVLTVLALTGWVSAEVRLPALISDHMLLQQEVPVRIWGWADPGEQVRVEFGGQNVSTPADAGGEWEVFLSPLEAGGPFQMVISGENIVTLTDVLVGEVWIASGQSNMVWSVRRSRDAETEVTKAEFPRIRLFKVALKVADQPLEDVEGNWQQCSAQSVADFSAVGYFFARHLHQKRGHPVGVIQTAWGGTPSESWTSRLRLASESNLAPVLENWERVLAEYPPQGREHQRGMQQWEQDVLTARRKGEAEPRKPRLPQGPGHPWTPGGLYNAMIAPVTPYAIRGAIWYQGENNAHRAQGYLYRSLFPVLIRDWRENWGLGAFPFLFVQLANFSKTPPQSEWPELREAQLMTLELRNTAMAVTVDIGDPVDIHPINKQDVGERLALGARRVAYGEDVVYSGPLFRQLTRQGTRLRVWFDHVGGGLNSKGGEGLRGFVISGDDKQFVEASARIDGSTVVVSSPRVANPVAVRYGWGDSPICNLYNAEGLPASPFRTDDWRDATMPSPYGRNGAILIPRFGTEAAASGGNSWRPDRPSQGSGFRFHHRAVR